MGLSFVGDFVILSGPKLGHYRQQRRVVNMNLEGLRDNFFKGCLVSR